MPLFNSRPPPDGLEGILQVIGMGECDENTIKNLAVLVADMSSEDVKSLADILMTNLVKYPDNVAVLKGSVEALETLPFLPKAKNEFIITLLLSLLKAPANHKDAIQRKMLKRTVIEFLLFFVTEDDTYAKLMMPEIISGLDDTYGAISSSVFRVLLRLATEKPEYFENYSSSLIKQLGSINKSTRAQSAKLIGSIAKTHPDYVSKAMPFLQSLASFYPDAHVKRNANEAYQIIAQSIKREPESPIVKRTAPEGAGLADIMKLNAGTPNNKITVAQFTDDELKDIIELTRKEFKSDAESILNSLGVGHLTVKNKELKARQKAAQPPKAAEVEAPPAPASRQKAAQPPKAAEVEAPPAPAPVKVKKVAVREKPQKPEKDEREFATLQADIDKILKREPVEMSPQKVSGKPFTLKCPKCGGESWANGQICDKCAAAEFDRRAVRGHYDI
jgi:hypothetical protein